MASATTQVVLQHSPTLTRVETHRVIAVLEKAVERLHLLAMLDEQGPKTATGAPAMSTLGGAEDGGRGVGGILEEQKHLEARYEELIRITQKQRHNPMDPQLDAACFSHVRDHEEEARIEELRDVSRRLKEQSRLLCRQLKDNPNDAENWQKIVSERAELGVLLSACVRELQKSSQLNDVADMASQGAHQLGNYEEFAKKVLEEQVASQWAEELVKREKETNQNVKQLQNEVKQERALKEEELEKRHKVIAELKTELRVLKQGVKERMDRLRAETEAATEAQKRAALDVQRVLNDRLRHLDQMVHNEETVTSDMKAHIESKLHDIDDETGVWTEKNTDAQRRMDTDKHNKQQERNELAAKLSEKQGAREAEQYNQKARDSDRSHKRKLREDSENLANEKYRAATKLQASIKGFFTRTALVTLKKKFGKKKK
jgi:IQ domain-containing protein G